MEKRFAVKNAHGKNVFSIDAKGDGFMDGQVKPCYGGGCEGEGEGEGQTPSLDDLKAAGGKWVIQDGNGTVLAVVDPEWGGAQANPADAQWPTLYLKGRLVKQPVTFQGPSVTLTPPDGSFVIKNSDGVVAAYINSVTDGDSNPPGSLVLAGYFFEGHNPDPQAMKTVFLFYDQCPSFASCVTRCSPDVYSQQCPGWTRSGSWSFATDDVEGPYCVTGTGSLSIPIPQDHPNTDINVDFEYQADTSGNVSPAQIVFRQTSSDSLCLEIAPNVASSSRSDDTLLTVRHGTLDIGHVYVSSLPDPTRMLDYVSSETANIAARSLTPSDDTHVYWYEVHIQAVGNGILVLFRNRDGDYTIPTDADLNDYVRERRGDDSGAGYKWIRWTPAITLPTLTGAQAGLALVAQSGYASTWSFDNVMVNSVSSGS